MTIYIPITPDMEPVKELVKQWEQKLEETADEIERLTADRDRWRSLAERAMDLLEEANRVLAQIQEGLKHD